MTNEPEPEIIEVVEEILDNQMFLVAVAVGAVIGGIALYLYLSNRGQIPSLNMRANRPTMDLPNMPEDSYEAGEGA